MWWQRFGQWAEEDRPLVVAAHSVSEGEVVRGGEGVGVIVAEGGLPGLVDLLCEIVSGGDVPAGEKVPVPLVGHPLQEEVGASGRIQGEQVRQQPGPCGPPQRVEP